jgi:hypothetical protein
VDKDEKIEERKLRMYPDKGLVHPKGEFRSSLADLVAANFRKLPGR